MECIYAVFFRLHAHEGIFYYLVMSPPPTAPFHFQLNNQKIEAQKLFQPIPKNAQKEPKLREKKSSFAV